MRGLVLDPEERPVLLAPGNYDADMWSDATGLSDFDASRTVQSEAEDADEDGQLGEGQQAVAFGHPAAKSWPTSRCHRAPSTCA